MEVIYFVLYERFPQLQLTWQYEDDEIAMDQTMLSQLLRYYLDSRRLISLQVGVYGSYLFLKPF